MRTPILITLASLCWITVATAQYSVGWSTLDGGGPSSGGNYSMNGTIGQPDAGGPMNGGVFTFTGGFWPGVTDVDVGAIPGLAIRLGVPSGGFNTVILTWPNPSTGYVLQQNPNMNGPGGGWVNITQTPAINGSNKEVTLTATGAFCVFRLRRP
jgi:hypothetical protein